MLDEDEALTLAALLEELAARREPDPLSARALRAAALLRRRVAARQGQRIQEAPVGPAARREAGDTRDDDADVRDARAGQRDAKAAGRDREADAVDREAVVSERRVRDLLWDAELRDQAAAAYTAAQPLPVDDTQRQQEQLDRTTAAGDRARDQEDREAVRKMLSQAFVGRQASRQDRAAARQDRYTAQADRDDAARDRQAARADRDQAVIENEEVDPQALTWRPFPCPAYALASKR